MHVFMASLEEATNHPVYLGKDGLVQDQGDEEVGRHGGENMASQCQSVAK